jgi:hypothetical protein
MLELLNGLKKSKVMTKGMFDQRGSYPGIDFLYRNNASDNFHGIAMEYKHTYEILLQHYESCLTYTDSSHTKKEKCNEAATR